MLQMHPARFASATLWLDMVLPTSPTARQSRGQTPQEQLPTADSTSVPTGRVISRVAQVLTSPTLNWVRSGRMAAQREQCSRFLIVRRSTSALLTAPHDLTSAV